METKPCTLIRFRLLYPCREYSEKLRKYEERLLNTVNRTAYKHRHAEVQPLWGRDRFLWKRQEFWAQDLRVLTHRNQLDDVAEKIVKSVRKVGLQQDYRCQLLYESLDDAKRESIHLKNFGMADESNWKKQKRLKVKPTFTLNPRPRKKPNYPERIADVAMTSLICEGVGGNEVIGLFEYESDLNDFWDYLKESEQTQLIETFNMIRKKKLHHWHLKWLRDFFSTMTDDFPLWANEFTWLLGLLDRINLDGRLNSRARTKLLFWNPYDCMDD